MDPIYKATLTAIVSLCMMGLYFITSSPLVLIVWICSWVATIVFFVVYLTEKGENKDETNG